MNYNCEICDIKCKYLSQWNQHIQTKIHLNNGIRTRTRIKEKICKQCDKCDYEARDFIILQTHILTKHSSKNERENTFTYYCKFCDFGSFNKLLFDKHNKTKKHLQILSLVEIK